MSSDVRFTSISIHSRLRISRLVSGMSKPCARLSQDPEDRRGRTYLLEVNGRRLGRDSEQEGRQRLSSVFLCRSGRQIALRACCEGGRLGTSQGSSHNEGIEVVPFIGPDLKKPIRIATIQADSEAKASKLFFSTV